MLCDLAAQKNLFFAFGIGQRPQFIAHTPGSYHLLGEIRGLFYIIGCPRADALKDDFFGHATAEGNCECAFKMIFISKVPLFRQKPGNPGSSPARYDGDFVDGIGFR